MSIDQPTGEDMHRHETPVSAMTEEGLASGLAVVSIAKSYDKRAVLTDVSLSVAKGEVVGLLGPNGAGKTTALRMIAGFETPTSGDIRIDDASIVRMGANRRPTAMVFQQYTLWPHMTVYENIAFGLNLRRMGAQEIARKVSEGLGLVGLEAMASGAACVLTDSGGVMEYARHDDNALVVPPGDEQALAAAILRLVEDRPLRERLAQSGLATARTFTWRRSAEAFHAFLRALPAPVPVSAPERAALELLWQTRNRDRAEIAALAAERAASREGLAASRKSTFWKAAEPYWRWKARLTGRGGRRR